MDFVASTRRSSRQAKTKRMEDYVQYTSNKRRKKGHEQKKQNLDHKSDKIIEDISSGSKANDKKRKLINTKDNSNITSPANNKQSDVNNKSLDSLESLGLNKDGMTYEINKDAKVANNVVSRKSKGVNTLSDDEPKKSLLDEVEGNENSAVSSSTKTEDLTTSKNKYKCEKCFKVLNSKDSLSRHMYRHTGQKPHKCDICEMTFSMKGYLKSHMQCHTKERSFICEVCGKGFGRKATLITHMLSHTDKKDFSCEHCDKIFKQRHSLIAHQSVHTPDKMTVCHMCGKSFSCKNYLVQHLKSHSGEPSFRCEQCGKAFPRKQTLEEHCRRHIGQKNVECPVCCKKFYNRKELKKHMQFHVKEGDYQCEPCKMFFSAEKSLFIHDMKIHKKQHKCTECDSSFTMKRKLESHMKKHFRLDRKKMEKCETANFKKIKCALCDKVLSNKYRLQKHSLTKHGLKKPKISRVYYDSKKNLNIKRDHKVSKPEANEESQKNVETREMINCYGKVMNIQDILNLYNSENDGKDNNARPIIYILEEEISTEASEPGIQTIVNVAETCRNSVNVISTESFDPVVNVAETCRNNVNVISTNEEVFIPQGLDKDRESLENIENKEIVTVNDIDGRNTSITKDEDKNVISAYEFHRHLELSCAQQPLHEEDDNVYNSEEESSAVFDTVDHEVIIQPDDSVVVCIKTPVKDQAVTTEKETERCRELNNFSNENFGKNKMINNSTNSCASNNHITYDNLGNKQVATSEGDMRKGLNYVNTRSNKMIANLNDDTPGNKQMIANLNDDIPDNKQMKNTLNGKRVEGIKIANNNFQYEENNKNKTIKPMVEVVDKSKTPLVENIDKNEIPSINGKHSSFDGVLPSSDSKEDVANFEISLLKGFQSLRDSEHYGELLHKVHAFVVKEQTKLNKID